MHMMPMVRSVRISRPILLPTLAAMMFACSAAGRAADVLLPSAETSNTLPLEVVFPLGSSVSTRLVAQAESRRLVFSIHGLELDGQATVQINDAAPVAISNTTVKILGPGLARAFPIGSSDVTYYVMEMPVQIAPGPVTIKFTLQKADTRVSGFRIVDLDLIGKDGSSVLPRGAFTIENPMAWSAPPAHASPTDVATGMRLFTQQALLDSPFNNARQRMHCSDCHASDGRDLKYFNFSNRSIISRSRFHGLSEEQGEQIAAYIRGMEAYQSVNGRPWNPPYQPGPGLDSRDVREWSAGAGVAAITDSQATTLKAIFPQGISTKALLNPDNPRLDPQKPVFGNLNLRELPIDLPLPDWNHWLPFVSIRDAVGGDDLFEKGSLATVFDQMFDALRHGDLAQYASLVNGGIWGLSQQRYRSSFKVDPKWLANHDRATDAQLLYSTNLWKNVRTWQLQEQFKLDDRTRELFPKKALFAGSKAVDGRLEVRAWPTGILFTSSPKFIDRDFGANSITGNDKGEHYLKDVWYWQQLLLNPGQGMGCGNNPVDWGYITGPIIETGTPAITGEDQFGRLVAMAIKSMQARDNGLPYGDLSECGWNPHRNPSIYEAFAHKWIADSGIQAGSYVDRPTYNRVMQALIEAWLIKNKTYSNEQWRAGLKTDPSLDPQLTLAQVSRFKRPTFGARMVSLVQAMDCMDDDLSGSQQALIGWLGGQHGAGGGLWPQIDWNKVASDHPKWPACADRQTR